jgi:hypothetical protein
MEGDTPHGGTNRHARPGVTLENYAAIQIWLECPPPSTGAVIVWRDQPKKHVRPEPSKPLRQLQPGDVVIVHGERRIVKSVVA